MNVLFADEQDEPIVTDELLRLAEIVLEEEGLESETGVSLVLIDEMEMAELNEAHMGKQGPTDVLSFPIEASTPGAPPRRSPGGPPINSVTCSSLHRSFVPMLSDTTHHLRTNSR